MTVVTLSNRVIMACEEIQPSPFLHVLTHMLILIAVFLVIAWTNMWWKQLRDEWNYTYVNKRLFQSMNIYILSLVEHEYEVGFYLLRPVTVFSVEFSSTQKMLLSCGQHFILKIWLVVFQLHKKSNANLWNGCLLDVTVHILTWISRKCLKYV